jgi:predicted O-methyltransferase YrrM
MLRRMKQTMLRALPEPVIEPLRQIRNHRWVQAVTERQALRALPRATWPSDVQPRAELDLQIVWATRDPAAWDKVQDDLNAARLTETFDGINPGDRRAISALVAYLEPQRVLEIGTHIGASTVAIASTLAGTGAQVTSVDVLDVNDPRSRDWERYGMARSPAELVIGLTPVEFVVSDSVAYLTNTSDKYDFIFLDGDHSAATVYRELPLAVSRLRSGGTVLLHDYFPAGQPLWPDGKAILGPWLATRRLIDEGVPIKVKPLGSLLWPTKQGTNRTSLAVALSEPGSSSSSARPST